MKLAINGGSAIRLANFPKWPYYDESEEKALLRSLHQGHWWRNQGEENNFFEQEFGQYHNGYAVTVTSGTVALELALLASGIKPGDEVIVPAFTFISTSMAVQRVGAIPIAIDVLKSTYCIDPNLIEKNITPRTKAIIPVHMAGHLCDMNNIIKIANKHGIFIVQDAAHAHGACGEKGKKIGDWGTLACFSFHNFKLMTAGEGGVVLCPTKELRDLVFLYSNCGRHAKDKEYQHTIIATNARLSEFSAAVLRTQLKRLKEQTHIRERNAESLKELLKILPEVTLQEYDTKIVTSHPHYMFMFTLNQRVAYIVRDYFVACLFAEGIPAFRAYKAIYHVDNYWLPPCTTRNKQNFMDFCPVTEYISKRGVWIHHRALLGDHDDTLDIFRAIKKVISALKY
ncbi:DegT/DnrJ/EryC1/StrS family aminotransferase [Xenorhabdus griffiniae]|uniref:DegT/DnrJ/EryC1/StrS family aminotransferase n=1 Tax=Xenorhabdus griffiniae TaxID=351672 RepID=UPI0023586667|nr:DegT/DnrJ/EryC1/StrS family aminotransferase [Xenorhabdus griffiniae]MDC9604412.1 DegT/DnrJ/EryC1/StrS family aminotransferase [Xenorhabdus griffiniae]